MMDQLSMTFNEVELQKSLMEQQVAGVTNDEQNAEDCEILLDVVNDSPFINMFNPKVQDNLGDSFE